MEFLNLLGGMFKELGGISAGVVLKARPLHSVFQAAAVHPRSNDSIHQPLSTDGDGDPPFPSCFSEAPSPPLSISWSRTTIGSAFDTYRDYQVLSELNLRGYPCL